LFPKSAKTHVRTYIRFQKFFRGLYPPATPFQKGRGGKERRGGGQGKRVGGRRRREEREGGREGGEGREEDRGMGGKGKEGCMHPSIRGDQRRCSIKKGWLKDYDRVTCRFSETG
jgi:hypothetical protein